MLSRLLEDLYFIGRLGYFYHKASREVSSVGFNSREVTRRDKFKYAWGRTIYK